jgi:hypothetical protein
MRVGVASKGRLKKEYPDFFVRKWATDLDGSRRIITDQIRC